MYVILSFSLEEFSGTNTYRFLLRMADAIEGFAERLRGQLYWLLHGLRRSGTKRCNRVLGFAALTQLNQLLEPAERRRYTQESIVSSIDNGWLPIEPHEISLEGFDGAVKITVDSLLPSASSLASAVALGMTITLRMGRPNSSPSIDIRTKHAHYGALTTHHEKVRAFIAGRSTDLTFNAVGFRLRMYEHRFGVRTGTCVAVDLTDIPEIENFRWRELDVGNRLLLEHEAMFHFRFAFRTSVVDPPFVLRFAEDIHQLMRYVQSIGAL